MQKVSIYRGIEYVRISQLPEEQREQIKNWLDADMIIKIQTNKELLIDCVVYSNYVHWFKNIYTKLSPAETITKAKQIKAKSKSYRGLAFD